MSTVVVEQLRDSGMATPKSTSGKAQIPAAKGSKHESRLNRALGTVDKEVDKQLEGAKAVDCSNAVAVGPIAAVGDDKDVRGIKSINESAPETSRKRVEQMRRRLQVQLQFVEQARRQIMDETHADMVERLREAARERDQLLGVAKQRNEYFQHSTTVIFNYECDEANSEYDLLCEKLRQDMLEEIHHEMEILNDQRKGGHNCGRISSVCSWLQLHVLFIIIYAPDGHELVICCSANNDA